MLVSFYFGEMDLDIEDYYLSLAEEVKNIEKYDEKLVFMLLRYMEALIVALLKLGTVQKNSLYADSLVKFLEGNQFFDKIEFVLRQFGYSLEVINIAFNIVAYLQDYGIEELR